MSAEGKGSRKPRSPKAPSRKLGDCVEKLQLVHAAFSTGTFSRAEVASTIGSSAGSGKFGQWFTSFREYDLLDKVEKDKFQLSETFKGLHFEPKGSAPFKQHVLHAIRSSTVLSALLDGFQDKLPPASTVAQRLEREQGFNEEKAQLTAGVLEHGLEYGGLIDDKNNLLLLIRDEEPDRREKSSEFTDGNEDKVDEEFLDEPPTPASMLKFEVPLSDGQKVILFYPKLLSGAESERVKSAISVITE